MRLNDLTPGKGAKQAGKRLGRGHSAGQGKTSGRGQKGQHSRSGGYHKVGFEGGQMPLQRRLPKVGFKSRVARVTAEIRLNEIAKVDGDVVDMDALYRADIVPMAMTRAKIILSGTIDRALTVRGIGVTKGARAAIEAAGGKVED